MSALLDKPLYGDPCNSCGLCCIAEQCPISVALFGDQAICPAIEHGDGKALVCGVIANPADYLSEVPDWSQAALSSAFALILGAGSGCDGQTPDDDNERIAKFQPVIRQRAHAAIEAADPTVRTLVAYLCDGHAARPTAKTGGVAA